MELHDWGVCHKHLVWRGEGPLFSNRDAQRLHTPNKRSSWEKIKDRINTNRLFVILFKCRECREVQDQIIQNVSILCRECRHGSFYSTLNLIDFMSLVSRDQRQNSITNNIECIDFMSWVSTASISFDLHCIF